MISQEIIIFYAFHLLNIFLIVFLANYVFEWYLDKKFENTLLDGDIEKNIELIFVDDFGDHEKIDGKEEEPSNQISVKRLEAPTKDDTKGGDSVNHPKHYNQFSQEVIVTIEEWVAGYDKSEVAYCLGNTLKYISRAPYKHETPLEDLKKAQFYLREAINLVEEE
ncbi:TPA: DUF3310 domain-containing protein [Streptococcus suis]